MQEHLPSDFIKTSAHSQKKMGSPKGSRSALFAVELDSICVGSAVFCSPTRPLSALTLVIDGIVGWLEPIGLSRLLKK